MPDRPAPRVRRQPDPAAGNAATVLANERFHDGIGQAARNPYLCASCSRILAGHARIAELTYGYENEAGAEDSKELTRRENREHYDAIAAGNAATADRVIQKHMNRAADMLRRVLERSGEVLADVYLGS